MQYYEQSRLYAPLAVLPSSAAVSAAGAAPVLALGAAREVVAAEDGAVGYFREAPRATLEEEEPMMFA